MGEFPLTTVDLLSVEPFLPFTSTSDDIVCLLFFFLLRCIKDNDGDISTSLSNNFADSTSKRRRHFVV